MPTPATDGLPRLLFAGDNLARVRRLIGREEGAAMLARLRWLLDERCPALDQACRAAGHGLLAFLCGDPSAAERSRELVELVFADALRHRVTDNEGRRREVPLWQSDYKMIIRSDLAVGVALAYDSCRSFWPDDFRRRVARELVAKASELIAGGGEEWNRSPSSNWHVNTRSAGGLCAPLSFGRY